MEIIKFLFDNWIGTICFLIVITFCIVAVIRAFKGKNIFDDF